VQRDSAYPRCSPACRTIPLLSLYPSPAPATSLPSCHCLVAVAMNANRQITGTLRGFDQFMNLVLDGTVDVKNKVDIGMVVSGHVPGVVISGKRAECRLGKGPLSSHSGGPVVPAPACRWCAATALSPSRLWSPSTSHTYNFTRQTLNRLPCSSCPANYLELGWLAHRRCRTGAAGDFSTTGTVGRLQLGELLPGPWHEW